MTMKLSSSRLPVKERKEREVKTAPPAPKVREINCKPTIAEAVEALSTFSKQPGISEIISVFCFLEIDEAAEDKTVDELRAKLQVILQKPENNNFKHDGLTLCDAAHQALLALALYRPINPGNLIDGAVISDEDHIVTADGYQFNIEELINWHNTRECRWQDLRELPNKKYLLNPYTRSKINPRGVAVIKAFAAKHPKKIVINDLWKEETVTPPSLPSATGTFFASPGLNFRRRFLSSSLSAPLPSSGILDLSGVNPRRSMDMDMPMHMDFLGSGELVGVANIAHPPYQPPNYLTAEEKAQLGSSKSALVNTQQGRGILDEGRITIAQIMAMDGRKVEFLFEPFSHGISLLRDGIINIDQINIMPPMKLIYLFLGTGELSNLVREGLLNIQQFAALSDLKLFCLKTYAAGRDALREGRINGAQIVEMSDDEFVAQHENNFLISAAPARR